MTVWQNPNKNKPAKIWMNPNRQRQEDPIASNPGLKEIFSMAYGPKGMQERREFETQARQNVPKVAANVGLGAIQEIANWPPNIANSFGINLDRADKGFTQYAPEIEGGEVAQDIGGMIPHIYGVTKGYKALNKAPYMNPKNPIGSYIADVAKIGGLEYLLAKPEHKTEAGLIGAGATAVLHPAIKLIGRLIGPNRGNLLNAKLNESREAEEGLKQSLKGQEEALHASKIEGAEQLGNESIARGANIENIQEGLNQKIPQNESQNIGDLTGKLTEAHADIQKQYEKMYGDFKNSDAGKRAIAKGITPEEIESISSDKNIPPELKSDIKQFIGHAEKQKAYTDIIHGHVPAKTTYHQQSGTVQDYLGMHKKARDEALKYGKMSKDRNATYSEKERYRELAKKYKKFQNLLEERITSSLKLPEVMEYQGIQDFFKNYEVPFRESSLLRKATAFRPKIKEKDFFGSLIRENEPKLTERLLNNHPEVKEAITRHDLMSKNLKSADEIEKLLSGDRGKALEPNVRADLQKLHSEMQQKEMVDKLLPEIGKSELSFVKKYPSMDKIFKQRPDLRMPFENIEKETARLNDIKAELEKAGVSRKEAEQTLKEYKESIRGLGSLLSIVLGNKIYYGARGISGLTGHHQ